MPFTSITSANPITGVVWNGTVLSNIPNGIYEVTISLGLFAGISQFTLATSGIINGVFALFENGAAPADNPNKAMISFNLGLYTDGTGAGLDHNYFHTISTISVLKSGVGTNTLEVRYIAGVNPISLSQINVNANTDSTLGVFLVTKIR